MGQVMLSDENCKGHGEAIFRALHKLGYVELLSLEFVHFGQVSLEHGADDETVWSFCQQHRYLLLTGNRTTKDGVISLEMTIGRLMRPDILPVLTVGNLNRVLDDPKYCERCAESLAEIVMDIEDYRGIIRLYL